MDSLTARLMSTSGLSRADPLLPPVNNVRMVHLKEPFEEADIFLHEARVALDDLEKSDTPVNKRALYEAMTKLEIKEADYFGTRRFGFKEPMFVGWRKELFLAKIREMQTKAADRVTNATKTDGSGGVVDTLHPQARNAARRCAEVWARIPGRPWQRTTYIDTRIKDIESLLSFVQGLNRSDARFQPSLQSIGNSLRDAKACQRLASLIAKDQYILPHDLGV